MAYLLIFAALIALVLYIRNNNRFSEKQSWQHFFDGADISATDFYAKVEEEIKEFNIPDISFSKETFFQTSVASMRQEYLKIKRGGYVIYICAAKFGRGTFISEWKCLARQKNYQNIPVVSKLLGIDRNDKSFYQADTEAMFQAGVHRALLNIVESLSKTQGFRVPAAVEHKALLN